VERDPAGVTAHHLDDEDAVMALRGRVQTVDRLGGDVHGGIEAERDVGGTEIVVDRLRHADDRQLVLGVQARGGAERVFAADRDQRLETVALERRKHLRRAVVALEHVRARGAQDRAAAVQDADCRLDAEFRRVVLERAAPAVAEADELVAVALRALAHRSADDRVQARAVASAGEHAYLHDRHVTRRRERVAERAEALRIRPPSSSVAGGKVCALVVPPCQLSV